YFLLFILLFYSTSLSVIYTLSLHDALPICPLDLFESDYPTLYQLNVEKSFGTWTVLGVFNWSESASTRRELNIKQIWPDASGTEDRKSTRLNSSHVKISYAVFCLKKKNK